MKRKAKKKAASVKAWGARLDQAKDAAAKKQQIRSHNLDARKQGGAIGANLNSKRIVEKEDGKKKEKRRRAGPYSGNNRAGFEGKKQGFLNDAGDRGKKGKNHQIHGRASGRKWTDYNLGCDHLGLQNS